MNIAMRSMLPPSRTRRIAKWTGLVVCIFIVSIWLISQWWLVQYQGLVNWLVFDHGVASVCLVEFTVPSKLSGTLAISETS